MIDIIQYRSTIGAFNLNIFSSNRSIDKCSINSILVPRLSCRRLFVALRMFIHVILIMIVISQAFKSSICRPSNLSVHVGNNSNNVIPEVCILSWIINSMITQSWIKMLGNFFARYLHGNKVHSKGVRVFHFNIRNQILTK